MSSQAILKKKAAAEVYNRPAMFQADLKTAFRRAQCPIPSSNPHALQYSTENMCAAITNTRHSRIASYEFYVVRCEVGWEGMLTPRVAHDWPVLSLTCTISCDPWCLSLRWSIHSRAHTHIQHQVVSTPLSSTACHPSQKKRCLRYVCISNALRAAG